jgi:hypothetical protein
MNDFFGFDFVGILILLCILIYLLFDLLPETEIEVPVGPVGPRSPGIPCGPVGP